MNAGGVLAVDFHDIIGCAEHIETVTRVDCVKVLIKVRSMDIMAKALAMHMNLPYALTGNCRNTPYWPSIHLFPLQKHLPVTCKAASINCGKTLKLP